MQLDVTFILNMIPPKVRLVISELPCNKNKNTNTGAEMEKNSKKEKSDLEKTLLYMQLLLLALILNFILTVLKDLLS